LFLFCLLLWIDALYTTTSCNFGAVFDFGVAFRGLMGFVGVFGLPEVVVTAGLQPLMDKQFFV
jgi:hypothetical protein